MNAAPYARVSSDIQRQERTIESQLIDLRKRIARAGHVLVKESSTMATAEPS
jgi:DNA invertase Pin-like site-specific DNA recombinase